STPRNAHASTVARTASTPFACPATRGSRRCVAQRPLPSMMIATCRGTSRGRGTVIVVLVTGIIEAQRPPGDTFSDGHDLPLLHVEHAIDLDDEAVGELLDLVDGAPLVVFRDLLVLDELLQVLVGVAPQVADGDLGLLAFMPDDLDELAPALLGERRHRHADEVAAGRRIQPE